MLLLPPARRLGKQCKSRSRGAVFWRPSYALRQICITTAFRPSSDQAGGGFFRQCHDQVAASPGRSPDGAKRNPGTIEKLQSQSRISLRSIRATKKRKKEKEAERRKTLFRNLRSLAGCGAHPIGRARLPAFHRGSRPRDSRIPRLNSGQASWIRSPNAADAPPAPYPVAASTSHAGHCAGRHDVRAAREQR
jgi:hypothetical protein